MRAHNIFGFSIAPHLGEGKSTLTASPLPLKKKLDWKTFLRPINHSWQQLAKREHKKGKAAPLFYVKYRNRRLYFATERNI
ncbi:hypothetical protein OUZ56_031879 [Daphnia magna]|uniref:Uncharacterized protein n=1 Tax=Daphnia magna TaxID=35525 RepID=A0ABQ9ZVI1_9CRUS|nr:hypothetical protein OUZ56_031879 [Daphnia magna]